MVFQYLVTTDKDLIPKTLDVVMVDGTVPGWTPNPNDLHFDHHRAGGAPVQLEEIGMDWKGYIRPNSVFVTTQVDADACVAAAWLQLQMMEMDQAEAYQAWVHLYAIAHDCDHLGLPQDSKWDPYRDFARKAVATLKEHGKEVVSRLELPSDRKTWDEHQKVLYASACFMYGTEWLIAAVLGERPYPGENGEADPYFENMEKQRPIVYANTREYQGCAIFDQRIFNEYVDPRLLVDWCRENNVEHTITLTVRDGSRQPNAFSGLMFDQYSYTLGSVPLHPKGSPKFSDNNVWYHLDRLELLIRDQNNISAPQTKWGGRNEVGGSSWRDPAIASPEQVINAVLNALGY